MILNQDLKNTKEQLEYLQKHWKENDLKSKKLTSTLKDDNKTKEREMKKVRRKEKVPCNLILFQMENELNRSKEKISLLEEKVT